MLRLESEHFYIYYRFCHWGARRASLRPKTETSPTKAGFETCFSVKIQTKNRPDFRQLANRSGFRDLGHAVYVDRIETLGALCDVKRDAVAFAKVVERHIFELVGVEKDILFPASASNEAESPVGDSGNSSFLHTIEDTLDL